MGRAIVRDPKAFLMDEPLSNLDAKLRVQMRAEVARIQKRLGTTTIYVTHDQTEALTLGDRVAVMRGGIIQQVDTPKVLYKDPVNLFVAGFIGSPAMNFVPATLENDKIRLPFGEVDIPGDLRARMRGGARDVIAGIRPEHFEDARIGKGVTEGTRFKVRPSLVESMGSELYAYFDFEGEDIKSDQLDELAADAGVEDLPSYGAQVIARLDAGSRADTGEEVELVVDTTEIRLFDKESGRSLTAA